MQMHLEKRRRPTPLTAPGNSVWHYLKFPLQEQWYSIILKHLLIGKRAGTLTAPTGAAMQSQLLGYSFFKRIWNKLL